MVTHPNLISMYTGDTQQLVTNSPPQFHHPYKRLIYHLACPLDCTHAGRITLSRWQAFVLPEQFPSHQKRPNLKIKADVFGYEPTEDPTAVEWYLNFAHRRLFMAYGGALFAQDEIQVMEHPALGALREMLLTSDIKPLTVEDGQPTPILIQGVERRCKIALEPNAAQMRPYGLYGNNFARADMNAIKLATTALKPPTITNLIAMEAPSSGDGFYTKEQINYILTTAFTGFSAARIETNRGDTEARSTIIHTGFWGCGAYGGNRVLMALLQLLAATLANIEELVFHALDETGLKICQEAKSILDQDLVGVTKTQDMIDKIYERRFEWGQSDGN